MPMFASRGAYVGKPLQVAAVEAQQFADIVKVQRRLRIAEPPQDLVHLAFNVSRRRSAQKNVPHDIGLYCFAK